MKSRLTYFGYGTLKNYNHYFGLTTDRTQIKLVNMYQVKDKVFLVTGGAAGIGAGMTKAFLAEGAKHVAVLDLDIANGKALETELATKHGAKKVKFYKCDVTTKDLEECIEAVFKEQSYIDCVVNNAGIMNDRPKVFVKEMDVNVTALIRSSMKAYEIMRKDHGGKGGSIINISSVAGLFRCTILPIYSATKAAVLQFSNCLGAEPHYSRSKVRFVSVCFGATDTPLLHSTKYGTIDKDGHETEDIEETVKQLVVQTPECAVVGLIEAYKRGDSASTWLVTNGKPAEDISANVEQAYSILSQGIFNV